MNRQQAILRELNLYPLWRLREGAAVQAAVESIPHIPAQVGRVSGSEADIQQSAMGIVQPVLSKACPEPGRRADGFNPSDVGTLDWPELRTIVRDCTACKLRAGCTQTVFGVGDEKADWLFVGEGPGADEDARGEPFVGQAGKLLDSMLAAVKLKRGVNVYIANIVKCRPPGNRTPQADEIAQCLPYLTRQITLAQPKLIVALGKTAATTLLGRDDSLADLRGKVHEYHGVPLVITYHPAYLLRAPLEKAKAWQDFCLAVETMRGRNQS